MIKLEKLSENNLVAYNLFLMRHPSAMFYHSAKHIFFLLDFTKSEQETILALEGNEVLGCLPMLSKEGRFGKVLNSLPFYGSHGAILSLSEDARISLEKHLHKIKSEYLSSVFIMNPYEYDESGKYGIKVDERIGQFTSLPFETEKLLSMFHFKTRNMVRKGEKTGATVNICNDDFPFLCKTHAENLAKIGGRAKPKDFFDLIPTYFKAGTDYNIFTAELNGNKIASLLVFYFKDTVEYYTPVIDHDYRDSQALSWIIYNAMMHAVDNGFKVWNWGGTWKTQEGVYRFKSRWGAEDKNYSYYMSYQKELIELPLLEVTAEYPWYYIGPYSMWERTHA